MGHLRDVFKAHADEYTEPIMRCLNAFMYHLQYQEIITDQEKCEILRLSHHSPKRAIETIFNRVEAREKLTEFLNILEGTGHIAIAELIKLSDCNFTKELQDVDFQIGGNTKLICKLDKDFAVRWYKDGAEIYVKPDKYRFVDDGNHHELIIIQCDEDDKGEYSCECGVTRTNCMLKLGLKLVEGLKQSEKVFRGNILTLTCSLNGRCNNVQWLKDGKGVPQRANTDVQWYGDSRLFVYSLVLEGVKEEDGGVYTCIMDNFSTACSVVVTELPATTFIDSDTTVILYDLERTKKKIDKQQNKIDKKLRKLSETEAEIQKQERKLSETEAEVQKQELELKEKEKELKEKSDQIDSRESELSKREREMREREIKIQERERQQEELKQQKITATQMQTELSQLREEKEELEERVNTLESFINKGNSSQNEHMSEILQRLRDLDSSRRSGPCTPS